MTSNELYEKTFTALAALLRECAEQSNQHDAVSLLEWDIMDLTTNLKARSGDWRYGVRILSSWLYDGAATGTWPWGYEDFKD